MQKIKENKINAWGIIILDVKIYYRPIVIKTMWYWHKNRHVEQLNHIKDPNVTQLYMKTQKNPG